MRSMSVLDVLTSPWAIRPEKLLEMQGVYVAHSRGDKVDLAAVEQRLGRPLANEPKRYDIVDGVAVLPLEGVIAKRMNLMMQISGGTSSELLARDLMDAVNDPAVHSIVLAIDSPGGTVSGTQALAQQVQAARQVKPVVAVANGMMASAAYWIGSAASEIYINDATTEVGSIGVVATHTDVSGAEAQRGVKTTEIVAGAYKRIASQYGPLTEAGRQTIQDQVDYTYSLFVEAVAQHRGVTADKVLKDMADGRTFMGRQAVDAGLVDGIKSLQQVITDLNSRRVAGAFPPVTKGAAMPISRESLAAEAPDLIVALKAEGAAEERARIQAVEDQLIPGHEALISALKFDGKTSGGDAAARVVAAEKAARTAQATALAGDAPLPVATSAAPAYVPKAADAAEDMSLPVEARCKAKWEQSADIQREFSSLAAYTAYVRASERGVARIMNKQGA